jgi:hypothetical protein
MPKKQMWVLVVTCHQLYVISQEGIMQQGKIE